MPGAEGINIMIRLQVKDEGTRFHLKSCMIAQEAVRVGHARHESLGRRQVGLREKSKIASSTLLSSPELMTDFHDSLKSLAITLKSTMRDPSTAFIRFSEMGNFEARVEGPRTAPQTDDVSTSLERFSPEPERLGSPGW